MLRIAVPNKGSLAEPAAEMLREAGYRGRRDSKELILADADNDVEFFFLRPRDIAVYVGSGTLDLGITGRDLLLDSGSRADEVMQLGLRRLDLPLRRADRASPTSVEGRRRPAGGHQLRRAGLGAPGRARRQRRRWSASTAPSRPRSRLGVADVIADVVETGTTLRNQGLEVFGEPILRSEAVLIRPRGQHEPGGHRRPASAGCRAS